MIHVSNYSMDNINDLTSFQNLLNEVHIKKTMKILDIEKAFDANGVMHIFVVYKDTEEPENKKSVKFDDVRFPHINYNNE